MCTEIDAQQVMYNEIQILFNLFQLSDMQIFFLILGHLMPDQDDAWVDLEA